MARSEFAAWLGQMRHARTLFPMQSCGNCRAIYEEGSELAAQAEFSEGDKVCFVSGPLTARLATVEKLASGDRVRLLLEIPGNAKLAEASKDCL